LLINDTSLTLNGNLPESMKETCDSGRSIARLSLLNQGNDGAANHCRVRELAHSGYVFRGGDAETHGNWQLGERAQAIHQAARI
jgi:hypothetical protein